jgi:hypothetical protein
MVKVTVSDTNHRPAQWKFEADITNMRYGKKLFNSEFKRYSIKKSLLDNGDSLKLYTGPYKKVHITISDGQKEVFDNFVNINPKERYAHVDVSNLKEGLYTCKMTVDSITLEQDFYCGDLDKYYREKYIQYQEIGKQLNAIEQSNFEGLFKRLHIFSRREKGDFDHLCEYWNRLRIPTMKMLNQALIESGNIHSYFIRAYQSEYFKRLHHYSAYVPVTDKKALPVFIILDSQEQKVDDWTEHWRNSVADGVDQIMDLANEIGFIPVWTDCGGGKDTDRLLSIFNETQKDIMKTLPVDTNRVFLIGICESTPVALLFLHNFPDRIKGCGFINPFNSVSSYLEQKNDLNHKLCMICSYYDERIPYEASLSFFDKLKTINLETELFTSYNSTHNTCTKNYCEPVFTYLILSK